MATLWRAWRVVARRRGRPFADGLTVPSPAATEAAAEARVARAKAEAVKTNVSHAGYVTGSRVLGHHRGAPTMTYAVELHVTPDIVAHPPGGACDVMVRVCDGDGTRDVPSVTRWETDAYDFAVAVPRPSPAAPGGERHAGLVAAYTSALDAAWGIGATHSVHGAEPRHEADPTRASPRPRRVGARRRGGCERVRPSTAHRGDVRWRWRDRARRERVGNRVRRSVRRAERRRGDGAGTRARDAPGATLRRRRERAEVKPTRRATRDARRARRDTTHTHDARDPSQTFARSRYRRTRVERPPGAAARARSRRTTRRGAAAASSHLRGESGGTIPGDAARD